MIFLATLGIYTYSLKLGQKIKDDEMDWVSPQSGDEDITNHKAKVGCLRSIQHPAYLFGDCDKESCCFRGKSNRLEISVMDKLYLGIDFGTSTNFVTKYDFVKKVAVPVANMGGHGESNLLENSVYFESSGNVLIGGNADKKGVWDPLNYFRNIKKFIAQEQKTWKVPHLDYREYSA